jgi:ferrous iron transport protein B
MPVDLKTSSAVQTVALAGNPNSGKTTVFNALTKLRQKVGNYAGVTVEKKSGTLILPNNQSVTVIDLPGTYSLAVRSPDEQVARDVLLGRSSGTPCPDLVICVVDAGNLERNLYLVSQIQDLRVPMVIALNMMDEAERQGREIDIEKLSHRIGVPIYPLVANQNKGIEELKEAIVRGVEPNYERQWRMSPDLEEEAEHLTNILKEEGVNPHEISAEVLLILTQWANVTNEERTMVSKSVFKESTLDKIHAVQERLRSKGIRARTASIEARYRWIKTVLKECVKDKNQRFPDLTEKIDAFLTHKIFGWVFFFGIMAFMFYMIFTIAVYPMDWIDAGFTKLGDVASNLLPNGDIKDLVRGGIIPGIGGVVIFLPQILILYFFISLLQDTGYMARAAFIMDRVMSKVGLHGKSFIPLLSSFACAIPGIMATRTIESPKDRLVTILVAPLMSCSARLPVYAIMIAVLMPMATSSQKAGIMLLMYLIGIVGACVMAWVFKRTLLRSQKPVFIMELPPYRMPSWKAVVIHMWERSQLFLKRAGTVILAMSIILWALMTYPKHPDVSPGEALKMSFAGQAGTAIEPIIKPLGYDWRIGIGLIGSFAAREVFVSTMSIVFNLSDEAGETTLREAFSQATWPDGRALFTPLVCLSLMIFYVFALQCASTIAVVYRETGGWKWPLFQFVYLALLAYAASWMVFNIGRQLGFS